MKNLTTISLIIFSIITTAILTAGLVFYQDNKPVIATPALNNAGENNSAGSSSGAGANKTPAIILNQAEISKHNKAGDCWMIINSKIYNVSSYLSIHPGGAVSMTPYCGKDATVAFTTRGGGGSHSGYADSLLASYLVGNLNQAVTTQQIQTNTQNTNSVTPPAQNSGGGEFDD